MTKEDTGYLEMKPGAVNPVQESGRWPMAELCSELKEGKYIFLKRRDDHPALEGFLHPYGHNEIAPDYLLDGKS